MEIVSYVKRSWSNPNAFCTGVAILLFIQILSILNEQFAEKSILFFLLPFLLILVLSVFTTGYYVECIHAFVKKKKLIPSWENISALGKQGFLFIMLSLTWIIPFFMVSFIILLLAAIPLGAGIIENFQNAGFNETSFEGLSPEEQNAIILPLLPPLSKYLHVIILAIILILIADYFIKMALVHFSARKDPGDAFKFKDIFKRALSKEYFLAWIQAKLFSLLIVVFSFIPFASFILVPLASFVAVIVEASLLGEAYRRLVHDG